MVEPSTVLTSWPFSLTTAEAGALPAITWYVSTLVSIALFEAISFSVAFGTLAKAALVGARTVNGPLPDRVLTRPAFLISDTSVLNCGAPEATWTMFCDVRAWGAVVDADAMPVVASTAEAARTAIVVMRFFMVLLLPAGRPRRCVSAAGSGRRWRTNRRDWTRSPCLYETLTELRGEHTLRCGKPAACGSLSGACERSGR